MSFGLLAAVCALSFTIFSFEQDMYRAVPGLPCTVLAQIVPMYAVYVGMAVVACML